MKSRGSIGHASSNIVEGRRSIGGGGDEALADIYWSVSRTLSTHNVEAPSREQRADVCLSCIVPCRAVPYVLVWIAERRTRFRRWASVYRNRLREQ